MQLFFQLDVSWSYDTTKPYIYPKRSRFIIVVKEIFVYILLYKLQYCDKASEFFKLN